MSTGQSERASVGELSDAEREALVSAAVWYAKYHRDEVPPAGDGSAHAMLRRAHFENLHGGLRKLGVRLRRPPELGPSAETITKS